MKPEENDINLLKEVIPACYKELRKKIVNLKTKMKCPMFYEIRLDKYSELCDPPNKNILQLCKKIEPTQSYMAVKIILPSVVFLMVFVILTTCYVKTKKNSKQTIISESIKLVEDDKQTVAEIVEVHNEDLVEVHNKIKVEINQEEQREDHNKDTHEEKTGFELTEEPVLCLITAV